MKGLPKPALWVEWPYVTVSGFAAGSEKVAIHIECRETNSLLYCRGLFDIPAGANQKVVNLLTDPSRDGYLVRRKNPPLKAGQQLAMIVTVENGDVMKGSEPVSVEFILDESQVAEIISTEQSRPSASKPKVDTKSTTTNSASPMPNKEGPNMSSKFSVNVSVNAEGAPVLSFALPEGASRYDLELYNLAVGKIVWAMNTSAIADGKHEIQLDLAKAILADGASIESGDYAAIVRPLNGGRQFDSAKAAVKFEKSVGVPTPVAAPIAEPVVAVEEKKAEVATVVNTEAAATSVVIEAPAPIVAPVPEVTATAPVQPEAIATTTTPATPEVVAETPAPAPQVPQTTPAPTEVVTPKVVPAPMLRVVGLHLGIQASPDAEMVSIRGISRAGVEAISKEIKMWTDDKGVIGGHIRELAPVGLDANGDELTFLVTAQIGNDLSEIATHKVVLTANMVREIMQKHDNDTKKPVPTAPATPEPKAAPSPEPAKVETTEKPKKHGDGYTKLNERLNSLFSSSEKIEAAVAAVKTEVMATRSELNELKTEILAVQTMLGESLGLTQGLNSNLRDEVSQKLATIESLLNQNASKVTSGNGMTKVEFDSVTSQIATLKSAIEAVESNLKKELEKLGELVVTAAEGQVKEVRKVGEAVGTVSKQVNGVAGQVTNVGQAVDSANEKLDALKALVEKGAEANKPKPQTDEHEPKKDDKKSDPVPTPKPTPSPSPAPMHPPLLVKHDGVWNMVINVLVSLIIGCVVVAGLIVMFETVKKTINPASSQSNSEHHRHDGGNTTDVSVVVSGGDAVWSRVPAPMEEGPKAAPAPQVEQKKTEVNVEEAPKASAPTTYVPSSGGPDKWGQQLYTNPPAPSSLDYERRQAVTTVYEQSPQVVYDQRVHYGYTYPVYTPSSLVLGIGIGGGGHHDRPHQAVAHPQYRAPMGPGYYYQTPPPARLPHSDGPQGRGPGVGRGYPR